MTTVVRPWETTVVTMRVPGGVNSPTPDPEIGRMFQALQPISGLEMAERIRAARE